MVEGQVSMNTRKYGNGIERKLPRQWMWGTAPVISLDQHRGCSRLRTWSRGRCTYGRVKATPSGLQPLPRKLLLLRMNPRPPLEGPHLF